MTHKARQEFTPDEDRVIRECWATGTAIKAIARQLPGGQRTSDAIRRRATWLGLGLLTTVRFEFQHKG